MSTLLQVCHSDGLNVGHFAVREARLTYIARARFTQLSTPALGLPLAKDALAFIQHRCLLSVHRSRTPYYSATHLGRNHTASAGHLCLSPSAAHACSLDMGTAALHERASSERSASQARLNPKQAENILSPVYRRSITGSAPSTPSAAMQTEGFKRITKPTTDDDQGTPLPKQLLLERPANDCTETCLSGMLSLS